MKTAQLHQRPYIQFALVLTFGFLLLHIAGFRRYTAIWSGTYVGSEEAQLAGVFYLLLYLLSVCIVPILFLTEAIHWLFERANYIRSKRKTPTG